MLRIITTSDRIALSQSTKGNLMKMTAADITARIDELIKESGITDATIIAFGLIQRASEIETKGEGVAAELANLKEKVDKINEYYKEEEYEMTH